MKNVRNSRSIKRLSGYVMAGALAFGVAMTSLPATTQMVQAATVSVQGDLVKDNKFVAYEVFKGTEDDGKINVNGWGSGIDSDKFIDGLKSVDAAFENLVKSTEETETVKASTAQQVASIIAQFETDSAAAEAIAKAALAAKKGAGTQITGEGSTEVGDGYYLIVDETEFAAGTTDSVYNAALLQVAGDITIREKTDKPSVEKKVDENNADNLKIKKVETDVYGNEYNDVADFNIGDAVPFKLIGTIPNMSKYDTYKYELYDTLSDGLTAPAEADIHVYISTDKKVEEAEEITTGFTKEVKGQNVTVKFDDLKSVMKDKTGSYVLVTYDAVLNPNAVIGRDGNINEVYLKYSNKPDQSGEGEDHPTGETPKDYNIVFTYEVKPQKIDGATKAALEDAEFVIRKADSDTAQYASYYVEDNAELKQKAGRFAGWVDAAIEGTVDNKATTFKSGADGTFSLAGLDEGTYYLEETKAPTDYNALTSRLEIVLNANTGNSQTWDNATDKDRSASLIDLTATIAGEDMRISTNKGTAEGTVANYKGGLPETGGMGRGILYTLGASLVAAVGAVFGLKKRRA